MNAPDKVALRDDLVIGAEAVAAFLGMTSRQVYGCVERRTIPFFKIGNQICVRKSVIMAWIEEREKESMTGPVEP